MNAHDAAVTSPPWSRHLRAVERALGRREVDRARRTGENAQLAAIESLNWQSLIEVGQACLRLGGAVGARPSAEPEARRAYFAALYRACRENSFEGILRTAEAFADLGDHEAVEECLGFAELQADGAEAHRRMAAFVRRLELARQPLEAGAATDALGVPRTDAPATGGRTRHDA